MRTTWWTSRSNCLVFALKRWFSDSGYLVVRKSNFGWWPHFLWTPDINSNYVEHYAPIAGQKKLMPPPLFEGKVQTTDKIFEKNASNGFAKVESLLFVLFCLIVGSFGLIGSLLAIAVVIPIYKVIQMLAAKAKKPIEVDVPQPLQPQPVVMALEVKVPEVTQPQSIAVTSSEPPATIVNKSWTSKTSAKERTRKSAHVRSKASMQQKRYHHARRSGVVH